MITNFEDITFELTEEELRIVPDVCEAFRKYKKENPIKSNEIVDKINANKERLNISFTMTGARLRKICNYIRSNGMIPLIATSSGYYTDYSVETIQAQIKSLQERANSINRCASGLQEILNQIKKETNHIQTTINL